MSPETVIDIGQEAGLVAVSIAAPILLTGLAIGVLVGMIQAATQIQEMTLTFIPKLLGVFLALVVFGHWMLTTLTDYVTALYARIPVAIHG